MQSPNTSSNLQVYIINLPVFYYITKKFNNNNNNNLIFLFRTI